MRAIGQDRGGRAFARGHGTRESTAASPGVSPVPRRFGLGSDVLDSARRDGKLVVVLGFALCQFDPWLSQIDRFGG